MVQWSRSLFSIDTDDTGRVVMTITNQDNPTQSITMALDHETAARVAEALLLKVAYVEYSIQDAVERIINLE